MIPVRVTHWDGVCLEIWLRSWVLNIFLGVELYNGISTAAKCKKMRRSVSRCYVYASRLFNCLALKQGGLFSVYCIEISPVKLILM